MEVQYRRGSNFVAFKPKKTITMQSTLFFISFQASLHMHIFCTLTHKLLCIHWHFLLFYGSSQILCAAWFYSYLTTWNWLYFLVQKLDIFLQCKQNYILTLLYFLDLQSTYGGLVLPPALSVTILNETMICTVLALCFCWILYYVKHKLRLFRKIIPASSLLG